MNPEISPAAHYARYEEKGDVSMKFSCPKDQKQCRTFSHPDCAPSRTCRHGDWQKCYSDLLCPFEQEQQKASPTYPPKRLRDWSHLK